MANLGFPENFWKKEIRCGFPVGEIMKRNWAAQIELLEEIRELCERHSIRYFADGGTELGAVRHGGFIPWDDDVDLAFVGEDYIRFLNYAQSEWGHKYRILNAYMEEWTEPFSRIVLGDGMSFRKEDLARQQNCPILVGADIFPVYYVPRDEEKEVWIQELLGIVSNVSRVYRYLEALRSPEQETERRELEELLAERLVYLERQTGYQFTTDESMERQMAVLFDQICRIPVEEESDFAVYPFDYWKYKREQKYPKRIFEECDWLPFENSRVPVPKEYDLALRMQYGNDYMEFRRNTAGHDYPYFGKQIRELKNRIELRDLASKRKKSGLPEGDFSVILGDGGSGSAKNKCVVLYYTGVREMLIYGEYVVDKIQSVIQYFEANLDHLELWWAPESFECGMSLELVVPELMKEYAKLIGDYKANGHGVCDESGDVETAVRSCDCFYGDDGFCSELFRRAGKPVLIQDYHVTEAKGELRARFEHPVFESIAQTSDGICYATAANFGGLFELHLGKGICKYLGNFEGEQPNGGYLFSNILSDGERLFLVPCSASSIVVYEPQSGEKRSVNAREGQMGGFRDLAKYADGVIVGDALYLIGERYAYVARLDLRTMELERYEIDEDSVKWARRGAVLSDERILAISSDARKLLIFDPQTKTTTVLEEYDRDAIREIFQKRGKDIPEDISVLSPLGRERFRADVFAFYQGKEKESLVEDSDWIGLEDFMEYVQSKRTGKKFDQ